MASEMAMLLKIRADASQAVSQLRTVDGAVGALKGVGGGVAQALSGNFSDITGSVGGLVSRLGSVHPAAQVATAAVGALTAVAGAAAAAIWSAATAAGEYGSKLSDISDKTGLSAETLSSLDMAAQESGSSIEELGGMFTKFNKLIGEAAQGSDEAAKKLAQFGVTPKEALNDLEGSLRKVFARIVAMPTAAQQTKAAMDAFGRSGASILPVLKSFNGDLDALIARAKEAGFAIDDKAMRSMDGFDDMLARVKGQVSALVRQFGIQFLPLFTQGLESLSKWFSENKDQVVSWGKSVSDVLRGAWETMKDIKKWADANPGLIEFAKFAVSPAGYAAVQMGLPPTMFHMFAERGRQAQTQDGPSEPPPRTPLLDPEEELKKIEDRIRRVDAAMDSMRQTRAAGARTAFQAESKELIRRLEMDLISQEEFQRLSRESMDRYVQAIARIQGEGRATELAKEGLLEEEKLAINAKYDAQREQLQKEAEAHITQILDIKDKKAKDRAETTYRDEEKKSQRIVELAQKTAEKVQADLDKQLQDKTLSEQKHAELSAEAAEKLVNIQIQQLQRLKNYTQDPDRRGELDHQIEILEITKKILATRKLITMREIRGRSDERTKALEAELAALQTQLKAARRQREDNTFEREMKALEDQLKTTKDRETVLHKMEALETEAAKRARDRRKEDLEAEKKAALERVKGKENEEAQKKEIDALYKLYGEISEEEFQKRLKEIRDKYAGTPTKGMTPADVIEQWAGRIKESVGSVGASMATMTGMMLEMFNRVAEGIGNMVENWVLYGETGPAALKKVLAAALATFAAEAAVNAIRAAAYGFLMLAMHDYEGAAAAFKSAALWGAVAVAAGVAGRAVAGDSFKRETGKGSNTGTNSSSASGTKGGAWSSLSDQTVDASRNNPYGVMPRESTVVIRDRSGMFAQLFTAEVENNSRVRRTILKLVE